MGDDGASSASERWRKALLLSDATLQQAIVVLEASALQIALVVSPDRVLLGTLTDGDIRRALLRGSELSDPIDAILQRDPFVAPQELDRETVMLLMRTNKLHQVPVIDEDSRVVGLHLWDDLLAPAQHPNLMVIMAGGRGARLGALTEARPKPLLAVAGKPMLEHIIERAKSEGFERFTIAVHYLGHMIEDHFGDGSRWQVRIDYLREENPLGTAGSLGLLTPPPELPFLVSNGDVLTDIRYAEFLSFHHRHNAAASMAVRMHEWQHPFGVVRTEGVDIVGFEEKPIFRTHINAGIYVLEPAALDALGPGERCDMPTLFNRLQRKGARTIVYPMHEPWLDVGRPNDYARVKGSLRTSTLAETPTRTDD